MGVWWIWDRAVVGSWDGPSGGVGRINIFSGFVIWAGLGESDSVDGLER